MTMSMLTRREHSGDDSSPFGRIDRLFDEWMRSFPMRRPFGPGWGLSGEDLIRVDVLRDGDTQVVRAELAGIDPDKDVQITVTDGMLQISAQRRVDEEDRGQGLHAPGTALRQLQPRPAAARGRLGVRHQGHLQGRHPRDPRPGERAAPGRRAHQDRRHEGLTGPGRAAASAAGPNGQPKKPGPSPRDTDATQ